MEYNFTAGNLPGQLIKFSLPLLAANILQACYSVVDMMIVGQYVGKDGLAAISSASMICFIITSICSGITIGGSVLVAQYKGAGDSGGQRSAIGTLACLSAGGTVLVTAASLLLYRPVLAWMHLPTEAMPHGTAYMQVISCGTVFVFGYNCVCSVMRGLGDANRPLLFIAVATVTNILLDLLLVGGLDVGTRGAAIATVASQAISFVTAVWHLKRRKDFVFDFHPGSFVPNAHISAQILRTGIPTALSMAALNTTYLIVTGMFNTYGIAEAAAAGVGLKINSFVAMPCWAVGQAVTTMAGQNIGAGKIQRAGGVAKAGILLSIVETGLLLVVIQIFAEPLLSLFSPDPQVIRSGVYYLRVCCSLNFIPYAVMYILDSFATGAGFAVFSMANSLLHSVVMRLGLSVLLGTVAGYGYAGLCWAECVSPVLSALAGLIFFVGGKWKRHGAL